MFTNPLSVASTSTKLILAAVLVLALMFTGGFIGYKIQSGKVAELQAELTQIKNESEQISKRYAAQLQTAQDELKTLSVKAETEKQAAQARFEEYQAQQRALLSNREGEIRKLKNQVDVGNTGLASLRARLLTALSAAEKAELEAAIVREEKRILELSLEKQGLECLTVPIPKDYLQNLNTTRALT